MTVNEEHQALWLQATQWLWQQRKNAPPDADVWDLRFHWQKIQHDLQKQVVQGKYRLKPMLCYRFRSGERLAQWSAADALPPEVVVPSGGRETSGARTV